MSLDPRKIAYEAAALKAAGRLDEAIAASRMVVALSPRSAAAEHNLAAALGDAGRWREAEQHIRRAFSKGIDLPESWLVLARALQAISQLDEAEGAFGEALSRRPDLYPAYSELAQLRWMRTGDANAALAHIDAALRAAPNDTPLRVIKAKTLEYAGLLDQAFSLLADLSAKQPNDPVIAAQASQLAATLGNDAAAVSFGERAAALAPNDPPVLVTLTSAYLAAGQTERAAALAEHTCRQFPNDQHAIAVQATAWRILGDARYRALYDYDAFVRAFTIDTPKAWPDLASYLADLTPVLKDTHAYSTHPFHQSIRHGTQAPDILQRDHPALAALREALDGPIKRYIAALAQGADPLRARNQGGYAYQGMWSIRMSAGGFHINHVHQRGWLSSACYIEVPKALPGKQGWLKFGEPGVRTSPALAPEHFVEPAPGKLVLFPSYMWHGTVPFTGTAARMTIAFDLTPAPPA